MILQHHFPGKFNRLPVFSATFLILIIFIAVFAPFIANQNPWLVKSESGLHSPLLNEMLSGNKLVSHPDFRGNPDVIIHAPVPYSAGKSDFLNSDYRSPFDDQFRKDSDGKIMELEFRYRHWAGTDLRGCDVAAGLINGSRLSLGIGIISAIIAFLFAIILGGYAGWYSVSGIRIRIISFIMFIVAVIVFIHLMFSESLAADSKIIRFTVFLIVALILFITDRLLSKLKFMDRSFIFPVDAAFQRIAEIFSVFPRIMIILILAVYWSPSWTHIIWMLAITGWPDIARIVRAEVIRLRNYDFTDAARLSGAGEIRILFRHILPNALPSLLVAFVFTIALNILIESGLSFLGAGVPPTETTWGSLLASGKDQPDAWWLIVFPGIFLSGTIASLYKIARYFQPGSIAING